MMFSSLIEVYNINNNGDEQNEHNKIQFRTVMGKKTVSISNYLKDSKANSVKSDKETTTT